MMKTQNREYSKFDFFYMLVMVVYLGQATTETAAMYGVNILKHIIAFSIPIFLSIILLCRNKINFKERNYANLIFIFLSWIFLVVIKYGFGIINNYFLQCVFFLFCSITIAYIHIKVYKEKLFLLYENVIVFISILSIVLWLFAVLLPSVATPLFRSLPLADYSHYGNHLLYLFTWMDPAKGQIGNGLIRNAGCAWEPGRFAVMVCLAICFQYTRQGVKFEKNYKLFVLVVALALTQSTTGYFIFFLTTALFLTKFKSVGSVILFTLVSIGVFYIVGSVDFLGEKMQAQTDFSSVFYELDNRIAQTSNMYTEGEYAFSLDRFPAMYFELQNVLHDPLLGYTQMIEKSYFYNNISSNCSLTGGLVKIFGCFGVILGFYIYRLLYKSSLYISDKYSGEEKSRYALFLCILLSMISYNVWGCPIYMAVWLYQLFDKSKLSINS